LTQITSFKVFVEYNVYKASLKMFMEGLHRRLPKHLKLLIRNGRFQTLRLS